MQAVSASPNTVASSRRCWVLQRAAGGETVASGRSQQCSVRPCARAGCGLQARRWHSPAGWQSCWQSWRQDRFPLHRLAVSVLVHIRKPRAKAAVGTARRRCSRGSDGDPANTTERQQEHRGGTTRQLESRWRRAWAGAAATCGCRAAKEARRTASQRPYRSVRGRRTATVACSGGACSGTRKPAKAARTVPGSSAAVGRSLSARCSSTTRMCSMHRDDHDDDGAARSASARSGSAKRFTATFKPSGACSALRLLGAV